MGVIPAVASADCLAIRLDVLERVKGYRFMRIIYGKSKNRWKWKKHRDLAKYGIVL